MIFSNFFSRQGSGASNNRSLWDQASNFFASLANRFIGSSNEDAVLPSRSSQEDASSESSVNLNVADYVEIPPLKLSAASLDAVYGSQEDLSSVREEQFDDVNEECDSQEPSNEEDVEEVIWMESIESKNSDYYAYNSFVPEKNPYIHLKNTATLKTTSCNGGKSMKSTALCSDGSLRTKFPSLASGSTSGVYCSFNTITEGSTNDIEATRPPSSLANAAIGTIACQNIHESIVHDNDKKDELPQPSEFICDPCFVQEDEENCNDVKIHYTVVSPRTNDSYDDDCADDGGISVLKSECISKVDDEEDIDLNERQRSFVNSEIDGDDLFYENGDIFDDNDGIPISKNFIGFETPLLVVDSEDELENVEVHEYFEVQRRSLRGQYRAGPLGREIDQEEVEREIDFMIEKDRSGCTPEERENEIHIRTCPLIMDNDLYDDGDDEEFLAEQNEYLSGRILSSFNKNTPMNYHPIPMDDILEGGLNAQAPRICWVCPEIASDYHGDNITAVVPFANEITEEEQEKIPEQALTLRDKIRAKFRKIRQFFTRKNRVMPCDEQPQNEEENNQEAFLMKVGGTWNICYEAEAVDEETGQKIKAVVSTGQYQHPNSDDVRTVIAREPSLCTITEEGEEIKLDGHIKAIKE